MTNKLKRPAEEIQKVTEYVDNLVSQYNISLNGGTPLWFYILAESQAIGRPDHDGNKIGEGLGPVGGRIVGEVLLGLIELDQRSFMNTNRNWQPRNGAFTMKDLLTKQYEPEFTANAFDPEFNSN